MSEFKNKVVWITGGGSGIGRALAVEFARRGADVAVSGRRVGKLEETVEQVESLGGRGLAVQCDVTVEDDVVVAVQEVVDEFDRLDVAIANAGFGVGGKIEDLSAEEWRRQFDVNVVGAAITARHALAHLRKTDGRVVLMGSVAGMVTQPGNTAYSASKYAVRALGQGLAMELAGEAVSCTLVQPGFVASEIGQVDNAGEFHGEWQDKRPQQLMWPADKAARVIVDAIAKRKRDFTFTGHGKVAAFLGKHAPGLVHHAMTKFMKVE
jgi:NAD(P)-dependent dehydrogenase (short-subunit alcohol dehydrogenase family)